MDVDIFKILSGGDMIIFFFKKFLKPAKSSKSHHFEILKRGVTAAQDWGRFATVKAYKLTLWN